MDGSGGESSESDSVFVVDSEGVEVLVEEGLDFDDEEVIDFEVGEFCLSSLEKVRRRDVDTVVVVAFVFSFDFDDGGATGSCFLLEHLDPLQEVQLFVPVSLS